MVPEVFISFPCTVLFFRDRITDEVPRLLRPVPLFVTVQFETLTVAVKGAALSASIPSIPLDTTQFSMFISADAELHRARKPTASREAVLLRAVTDAPSVATSPLKLQFSRRT